MMSTNVSLEPQSKRQRIMIITTDESFIDQVEKTNDISLLKQIILSSENNSERSDEQTTLPPPQKKNKSKDGSLICVICGSSATGYNFGAIACESCKAFFRRNARKQSIALPCNKKGDCRITSETRRNCPACRLAKCFNSGMQLDRLLTVEQKLEKRRQIEENRQLALNSSSKTNEEEEDEEEVQLTSSTFSDDLIPSIDADMLFTDLRDFLSPQSQQTLINSDDLQRIETISNLYQNRIEFAARSGLPWDPSMHASTFLQVLNSHSVPAIRLLSFFKQIPEFNLLNVDDKVTLVKSNLLTIIGISSVLSFNTETHEFIGSDCDAPANTQFYPVILGYNTGTKLRNIFHSFLRIAKYDRKIIELTLIILVLTKGFSISNNHDEKILNDNMSVYRTQNYFVELLCKYMETMYGYKKATDLLSEFILHVVSWQTIHEQMRDQILDILSPEEINQLLPIMKSILRIS